jgi:hypothetical protein
MNKVDFLRTMNTNLIDVFPELSSLDFTKIDLSKLFVSSHLGVPL